MGKPLFALLVPLATLSAAAAADPVDFRRDVWPILAGKCLPCHGNDPNKLRGGLDLSTRAGMLNGGQSNTPVVVPGQPDKGHLHRAVRRTDPDLRMPPKENDRLSPEQVETLRRWVAGGAAWTSEPARHDWTPAAAGVAVRTSGGRSPEWTNRPYLPDDLWAFQPVRRDVVPPGAGHPIDAFLRRRLADKGFAHPAAPADRRTLLRRVTFDLTGLPPTPEELDAFAADPAPDAFERVVDRLLASPHHGERVAQHWLDVVRYADTGGFANDFERPNAWRYRDYVIRAFNQDRPFDRFTKEQLAGDELDPQDPEMLLAVGFLRMGPWEHTGMSVAALTRQHFLDDVTHAVGVTFLGQGLRCASCHDHKFDPIPTKDYYRLQAVFAPVQFAERAVPFLPQEYTAGFAANRAAVEARLRKAKDARAALRRKSDDAIAAFLKERGVARLTDLAEGERPRRELFGLSSHERSLARIYQKRIETFERELARFQPLAFSVYDGPPNNYVSNQLLNPVPARRTGTVPVVHVLPGGSLETPAEAVTPGVLSAVPVQWASGDPPPRPPRPIPEDLLGRRLALAQWIASTDNPLTARVIVNRVWQWHFGKGLVATPNNFGKMGKRPTHPELLDWLTAWFVDHGWSLKQLHRLIVTSAAYQQAGAHPDADRLRQADPNNDLLAYFPPRRLSAEELRDAMLAVTGELNRAVGGPGVFPEINWEAALQPRHVMGSVAPAYQPSPRPADRNRRTLYAFRHRTLSDPFLEVFNRPGSETSCDRRDQTTVTPQVFALFHGAFAHNRALALACEVEQQADTVAACIRVAFRRCLGRAARAEEVQTAVEHVNRMTAYHRQHPPTPDELPRRVKRKMVEEMTGEEYEWEEELDGMEGYQRDRQSWQVGPETRALADLCLVLMNTNEFVNVR